MVLVTLGVGATGCTSIYSRTQAQFPPTATAELTLRVSEAQKAEQITRKTGESLRDDLKHPASAALHETGFDRLEVAAYDFERRVLIVRDVAEKAGNTGVTVTEMERLGSRAQAWLDYVQQQRGADPASRLEALETLLLHH